VIPVIRVMNATPNLPHRVGRPVEERAMRVEDEEGPP
jgi:hypothetical protein